MRLFFLFVFKVFLVTHLFAQDIHFSQPDIFGSQLNPSLMGKDGNNSVFFNYRNQWPNIPAYTTFFFGYNHYIQKYKTYVGVQHLYDKQGNGELKNNIFRIQAAKDFIIAKDLLIRPSLQFGIGHHRLDNSLLTFGDMIDPQTGLKDNGMANQTKINVNTAIGTYLNYKNFELGFAFHNLIPSNQSFTGNNSILPIRSVVHSAYNINYKLGKYESVFSVYGWYKKQADFEMLLGGIQTQIQHLIMGVSIRKDDAFIGKIGFATKYFKASYSYDFTYSKLTNSSGGAHEFGIIVHPPFKPREVTAHKFTSSFM